jgi:hypothetical protein
LICIWHDCRQAQSLAVIAFESAPDSPGAGRRSFNYQCCAVRSHVSSDATLPADTVCHGSQPTPGNTSDVLTARKIPFCRLPSTPHAPSGRSGGFAAGRWLYACPRSGGIPGRPHKPDEAPPRERRLRRRLGWHSWAPRPSGLWRRSVGAERQKEGPQSAWGSRPGHSGFDTGDPRPALKPQRELSSLLTTWLSWSIAGGSKGLRGNRFPLFSQKPLAPAPSAIPSGARKMGPILRPGTSLQVG